jgi:tripartite-type tricarboxylate transporter receptor subunit TctC
MPGEIVQRLNQETLRILAMPDIRKRIEQDAFDPKPLKPRAVEALFAAEARRSVPVARAAMSTR